jgi:hypothetical protein
MSLYGSLSRHNNLDELAVARQFPSYQSVATRQGLARGNLGLGSGTVTAGTAAASSAMVTDANRGIGGFRDTRTTPVFAQGAANALNATGTLTAAMMVGGIVTSTTGAAVTATLDTGTLLETALIAIYPGLQNNDYFEFSVVNTGANGFTIATAAGWTDGGNGFVAVAAANSARFGVRRTAANTYTIFKIA